MYSPTFVSLLAHLATPEMPVSPTPQHVTDADHHVQISKWVSEQSRTLWTSDNAPISRGSRYAPLAKPEAHRESLVAGFVACVLGVASTGVMQRSAIGASG